MGVWKVYVGARFWAAWSGVCMKGHSGELRPNETSCEYSKETAAAASHPDSVIISKSFPEALLAIIRISGRN